MPNVAVRVAPAGHEAGLPELLELLPVVDPELLELDGEGQAGAGVEAPHSP